MVHLQPKCGSARSGSPHHQSLTPPTSRSSPQPLLQNHPRSPAGNSAAQSAASYLASYKPHAVGTHVGARSAGWHASSGTIVANPRRQAGEAVASSRCVDWRSSNPSPYWLRHGTLERRAFCQQRGEGSHEAFVERFD